MIYDCEIERAIPSGKEPKVENVEYCQGWTDYAGMGVSVVGAYVWDQGYRVFLQDNLDDFRTLWVDPDTVLCGFNSHRFDDRLMGATLGCPLPQSRSYDLLRSFMDVTENRRFSLDTFARANFLPGKSGSGAMAPIDWQQGRHGKVIDYCLNDVFILKQLMELVMAGRLRHPESGRIVAVPEPMLTQPGEIL